MDKVVILCVEDESEVKDAVVRDLEVFASVFRIEAAEDVAEAVWLMLNTRQGAVVDEINLSPQKQVIEFGKPGPKQKQHASKSKEQ